MFNNKKITTMKKFDYTSLENATQMLDNIIVKVTALPRAAKEPKMEIVHQLSELLATLKENCEALAPKADKKSDERKHLVELCNTLKKYASDAGMHLSTNQMLNAYYYDKGAEKLRSEDEWESKGYAVRDDAKKYLFWGKSEDRYTMQGKKYKYFHVEYRYDIKDVTRIEDDIADGEMKLGEQLPF